MIHCQANKYRISSNKRRASNKRRSLISTMPLGIHIEISASPLINAAPLNTGLIRIATKFYQKLNQNAYRISMQKIKQ